MKLSIITVTLNAYNHLKVTLNNVSQLSQQYNIEHIIIDGNSTDNTKRLLLTSNVTWISEKDTGIFNAMNKGISLATGDIILMLNAGDTLIGAQLIHVFNFFSTYGATTVLHCSINKIHPYLKYKTPRHLNVFNLVQQDIWFNHQGTFIPKQFHITYGGYSEKYKYSSDAELLVKWASIGVPFKYSHTIITNMLSGGASDKNSNIVILETLDFLSAYYSPATLRKLQRNMHTSKGGFIKKSMPYQFLLSLIRQHKPPILPAIYEL